MKKEHLINGFFIFAHALNYKLTGKKVPVPVMVSLGLTNRCNLNCPFCYAKNTQPKYLEYTTSQLFDYIDQFAKLGTRIFVLQGGEPLLRNDLKEIISYIKNKKRYCRISTNGLLVADKIDSLTELDQISFSLDGNEEVVNKTRGVDVYKKVVRGMSAAYERKIPLEIHASLIRESASNKESIISLLELANKYKTCVSFCISCVSGAENTKAVGSGDLTSQEIRDFYRFLIKLKKERYPISNTFNSLNKALNWPISYSEIGFPHNMPPDSKFIECRHGKLVYWLDANNTLYPCPNTFYRPEFAVPVENGNIKEAVKRLSEKKACIACGGSDESTTFLALKIGDWVSTLIKQLK